MIPTKLFFGPAAEILPEVLPNRRVVVITDENVDRLYPDLVHRYEHIIIGIGEEIKNLHTVSCIYDELMAMGADRKTFLLGIGGGIVTDITGFVAATYMRGVEFGFVSTTLLGQVDASIGGKNGVNVADYKNMVGTITQPSFVISDVEMLRTLPERELRAGMAEVVKSAIVGDRELFDFIARNALEDIYRSTESMQYIVRRAMAVKMAIVEEDERENGKRIMLNLGHTIGHAIEKSTHELNHGEAVAVGMLLISRVACRLGILNLADEVAIEELLLKLGFSFDLPVSMEEVLKATHKDKKRDEGVINVVLPVEIGECEVRTMTFKAIERLFL
ncbi:MAG: 3-dehydroquinate synthase [Alistipes sp.]|nr:3-dehydroquinate synthase [Alistipes sp.]